MTTQLKRTFFEVKEFPFLMPVQEAWQTIQAEWDGARDLPWCERTAAALGER